MPEVAGLDKPTGQPDGAIPVQLKPGSALIFDRRLLHAGTPNWAAHDRLLWIVGWAPRWLRPRDGLYTEPALQRATCPVVRQLLGETTAASGLFLPTDDDTPLRLWLRTHLRRDNFAGHEHRVHARVGAGLTPRLLAGEGCQGSFPRHPGRAEAELGLPAPRKYLSRGLQKEIGGGLRYFNPREKELAEGEGKEEEQGEHDGGGGDGGGDDVTKSESI